MSERKMSGQEAKKFLDDFSDRISAIDEVATAVLQSHFLVEKEMNRLLETIAKTPKHLDLDNAKFAQKMRWIRAFAPLADDKRWQVVSAFNKLRNKVAHKPDGPDRKTALQTLRKELVLIYRSSILNEQKWRDYKVVVAAALESLRFLAEILREVAK